MEEERTPLLQDHLVGVQHGAAVAPPQTQPRYSDQPLNREDREIRLLYLSPAPFGGPLRGHLRIVKLSSAPKYEALSYTWGERTLGKAIRLNNRLDVDVTDHLFLALHELRYTFHVRILWVDAICIDQTNDGERGHQVAFMGSIYTAASRVCVWLGNPLWQGWLTELVLRNINPLTVRDIYRRAEYHKQTFPLWFAKWYWSKFFCAVDSALAQNQPQWHTRAWVYQEVYLASRVAWCVGNSQHELSEREFHLVLSMTNHVGPGSGYRLQIAPARHYMQLSRLSELEGHLSKLAQLFSYPKGRESLCNHLDRCELTSASDPRDKVYSLLGVMDLQESKHVIPDYSKPRGIVFAEATFASIAGSDEMRILSKVTLLAPDQRFAGLPTWALNFEPKTEHSQAVNSRWGLHKAEGIGPMNYPLFPPIEPSISSDGRQLHLAAVLLDTTEVAGTLNLPRNPNLISSQSILSRIPFPNEVVDALRSSESDSHSDNIYTYRGSRIRACVSARIRDNFQSNGEARQAWSGSKPGVPVDLWARHAAPDVDAAGKPLFDRSRWYLEKFLDQARKSGNDPMLFLTGGGLLGVSVRRVEAGDVVALAKGSNNPLLLHKVEGGYEFCGLGHVPLLMDARFDWIYHHRVVEAQRIILV